MGRDLLQNIDIDWKDNTKNGSNWKDEKPFQAAVRP
jgi:hypothetical protein